MIIQTIYYYYKNYVKGLNLTFVTFFNLLTVKCLLKITQTEWVFLVLSDSLGVRFN